MKATDLTEAAALHTLRASLNTNASLVLKCGAFTKEIPLDLNRLLQEELDRHIRNRLKELGVEGL